MLILELAMRNALRNVVRSALTALAVILGTAMLVLAMAWIEGVFDDMLESVTGNIGEVRIVDPDFAAREQLMPMYENIADVGPVLEAVRAAPGVKSAHPMIRTGVTVTVGEEIGEVFAMALGSDPVWYEERLGLRGSLVEGAWFTDAPEEALIGQRVATRTGAKVGDEMVALGVTQDGSISPVKVKVVGIVAAGSALVDQSVFMRIERLQWLTDIPSGALEVLVYGEHRDQAPELAATLATLPATQDLQVQAWTAREPWAGMVGVTGVMQAIISGIIIFVTALGVWNTMTMSVLERTGEIGVMRAMGLTRTGAVSLFVIEALAIAVVGGALGVALGALPAYALEIHGFTMGDDVAQNMSADFPMKTTFYADMNWNVAIKGFLVGLTMAFVGAGPPALRAASIQPVTAMRSRR